MVKDKFLNDTANACFAVLDGHGGQQAAEFARKKLSVLLDNLPRGPLDEHFLHESIKQGKFSNNFAFKSKKADPGTIICPLGALPDIFPTGKNECPSFDVQISAKFA